MSEISKTLCRPTWTSCGVWVHNEGCVQLICVSCIWLHWVNLCWLCHCDIEWKKKKWRNSDSRYMLWLDCCCLLRFLAQGRSCNNLKKFLLWGICPPHNWKVQRLWLRCFNKLPLRYISATPFKTSSYNMFTNSCSISRLSIETAV